MKEKSFDNVHISKRVVSKLGGEWNTGMQEYRDEEDDGQHCVCLKA